MIRTIMFVFTFVTFSLLSCIGSYTEKLPLVFISTIASGILGTIISIGIEKIDFQTVTERYKIAYIDKRLSKSQKTRFFDLG